MLKPNSITLASSEPAPNYSSELAPNMFGASSELASVMECGFYELTGKVISVTDRAHANINSNKT